MKKAKPLRDIEVTQVLNRSRICSGELCKTEILSDWRHYALSRWCYEGPVAWLIDSQIAWFVPRIADGYWTPDYRVTNKTVFEQQGEIAQENVRYFSVDPSLPVRLGGVDLIAGLAAAYVNLFPPLKKEGGGIWLRTDSFCDGRRLSVLFGADYPEVTNRILDSERRSDVGALNVVVVTTGGVSSEGGGGM